VAESLINLIHLSSAIVWLGGVIFAKFLLEPSLVHLDQAEAGKLLAIVSKKFKLVSWTAMLLLIITGYLKTPTGMMFDLSSAFGQILTVKHLLVIAVLILGAVMGMVVFPALRRTAPVPGQPPSVDFIIATRKMKRLSLLNALLGIGIVVAAGLLR
jgi:uncharacterized membrane protein